MRKLHLLLFTLLSFVAGLFSFYFVHFTSDNVMLFTASRLFEARWIAKGIFPFFIPNMYGGMPFAFDIGIPNFHPFNLLFLLPYPWSYSLFVGILSFLFLIGFYLLFYFFSKEKKYSVVLTLILFFSGSGFIRLANPTVYAVIAHMGLFLFSILQLRKNNKKSWFLALVSGALLTVSGQFPIVLFGYLLGFIVGYMGKIPVRRLIFYFIILFGLMSWYFILSLPLNLSSTRITGSNEYSKIGNLHILHPLSFLFPYLFGEVRNGSRWFMDIPYQTYLSFIPMLFALMVIWKSKWQDKLILGILYISALGVVHIPLLRGAVQLYIIIHIYVLILMAQNKTMLMRLLSALSRRKLALAVFVCSMLIFFILQTSLFGDAFLFLYHLVKKGPISLFYDPQTIKAVGILISHNFLVIAFASICLLFLHKYPKKIWVIITVMIVCEGVAFNYLQMYFIPTRLISEKHFLPPLLDTNNYRIQSAADTIPYFGYFVYQENISLRPPFSKEKTIFSEGEQKSFSYLSTIFSYIPSSWSQVEGVNSVQGYSTFVPKKICAYFRNPSSNWREEYKYIIDQNPLFGIKVEDLCINSIETSRVTLNDPRWAKLGVRYFISDRPLKNYKLIYKDHRYFYENEKAPSIYRFIDQDSKEEMAVPSYVDPNMIRFSIKPEQVGKKLVVIINPDGFVVKQNGRDIQVERKDFELTIPVTETGLMTIYYSPIAHLMETVKQLVSSSGLARGSRL